MAKEQIKGFNNVGDVMVVGGGISGMQASLDLANMGFRVFLVEKSPALGGKMAQLDKTFPTNDCSMCIESPKFAEISRHPNISIMTLTEVDNVEGQAGDFKVTLTKHPRYIREDKCTGCGSCTEYCPVRIPNPYNQDLANTKAVHIYFPQASPLVTYIDQKTCLYLQEGKCQICVGVCEKNAINLHEKPEKAGIEVGAIILTPGYDVFDPGLRGDYGYGKMANVITSLDFERILCSTGPYDGEMIRPSDGTHPKNIAWIQCVGSRQVIPGGNSYCSAVCCTYTQKQVILAKDHDADIGATIFHNDIRAYGKDFERFYQRAENLPDVRFIRSYVSVGREMPDTKNVTIRYSTEAEGVKEEEFDLVVLSVGLNPPKDAKALAQSFGIELTQHGFCKTNPANPSESTRPGVYVGGAFRGPMDIPESILTAGAASALSSQLLAKRRGQHSRERVYPLERDVTGEDLKVGVFVCACGANIGKVVDVKGVVEYASSLPNVAHAESSLFACSTETAQSIAETIKEKGLNRVVVAACSPRTHEPLFRDTLREGGINQYFFDMANIREHSSWVHSKEQKSATDKSKDLVRMSVARASTLQPLQEFELPVTKKGLIIGGGIAGMTSALSLANQGFEVYLVEKEKELGGIARRMHYTLEGLDVQKFVNDLADKVYKNPSVHVSTGATAEDTSGYVGNFITKIRTGTRVKEIKHGIIIVATGAQEYKPSEYLYGTDDRVITQLELEGKIAEQDEKTLSSENVVMIQCVGCRNKDRNYCSRVCCSQAVKNALKLKEQNPSRNVYVIYRDMRTYGFREDYYREAANRQVKFIRYEPEDAPQVEAVEASGKKVLRIIVTDRILNKKIELDADLLALAAAVIPSPASQEMSKMLKVSLSNDGFLQEAHVKLRPVDTAADGVFLCGAAHYPKHIPETISQALAAAGRAADILASETVVASGAICEVNENRCIGCNACVECCTYGATELYDTPKGKKSRVNPVLCKGCGLCNAKCPTGAIFCQHYTNNEIFAQIDAAKTSTANEPERIHVSI